MEFIPLYFGDRLLTVNPHGVIGVVTLWSKPEFVWERFRQAGVDLDPATSPIAVFGTLYGNGLREMLRNLLNNPQIQVLLVCGHDRSGSWEELSHFFSHGLEPVEEAAINYVAAPGQAVSPWRIKGTKRLIDGLLQPGMFSRPPRLEWLGDPAGTETPAGGGDATFLLARIKAFFAAFETGERRLLEQAAQTMIRPPVIPTLPQVETRYFPSNPRGHQIVREGPLEAWVELLFLLARFGRRVTLRKGERLELQNLKVVVEEPREVSPDLLAAHNLDPGEIGKYYSDFLKADLRPDEAYTYGHRLRTYFGLDAVEVLAARLQKDPEDRKAYFTLWDNRRDLSATDSRPCFVSVFVRKFQGKLTLTATFRTHNALDAWLLNFYGLMRLQQEVAGRIGLEGGAITVFSHSISIDPRELDRALTVVGKRRWKMRLDPMGYFRVTLDGKEILVEHRFEDATLKEYRGRTAVALQHQIARDGALSDINHAIYLGRQLAKAEQALREGREFVQD
ncbi:MAG: thymidylate synthase [Desulfobaccales bacterium]